MIYQKTASHILGILLPVAISIMMIYQISNLKAHKPEQKTLLATEWAPQVPKAEDPSANSRNFVHEETLKRPLFMRNRRPYEAAPPASMAIAQTPPMMVTQPSFQLPVTPIQPAKQLDLDIKVSGIFMVGPSKRALLTSRSVPQGEWMEEGSDINGLVVTEIRRDSVVLKGEGQDLKLELYPVQ